MSGARRGTVEISRAIFIGKITPALECPPRSRLDQNEFWLEHQMTPAHTRPVHQGTHIQKPLPAQHIAANYPEERPVLAQLIRALGHHARFVDVLAGLALTPPLLELAGDPLLQLLDGVATDAQLNEMERQEISPGITPGGLIREDSLTAYCGPGEICNGAPRLPPLFTGTAARVSAIVALLRFVLLTPLS
jgi:hypothetical protein